MLRKFQLKNGLKVVFIESHKSPVISVQMWVKTGSADENKKEKGISHFIEHLLFKGTQKFGVGEIAAKVEGSGGELNAYTSFDQTVYYITISQQFIDVALEAISEMIGHPLFKPDEIENEREVVIEEIKRGQDNPHRRSSQLLFSTCFKQHPYGEPVIGYESIIRKVSRQEILDYFHRNYVASNMTLIVVGDFEPKTMKEKINPYFHRLSSSPVRKIKRKIEPIQKQSRVAVEKVSFKESLLNLAWKTPSVAHKDIPALDVLSLILGQGDSARLTQKLRLEKPLVNYVSSSHFSPINAGFFSISLATNRENLEPALDEINKELNRLLQSPPQIDEMEKAIINIASEQFYSLETVDGLARTAGTYEHLFRDFKYFEQYLKMVNNLQPKDILRVARKYLKPQTLNMTLMISEGEDQAQKLLKSWIKKFKTPLVLQKSIQMKNQKPKKQLKLKWKTPNVQKITSKNLDRKKMKQGILITHLAEDTPVVNLRSAFRGGVRLEDKDKLGLTELLSRTWATATKSFSEGELYQKLEGMASGLSSFGGRNTIGLNLTTLSSFMDTSLELYGSILMEPLFAEEIIEREKMILLEQIKNRNDHPTQMIIHNFMENLFGTHPYGRDPLGTELSVKNLKRDDIIKHFQKMVSSSNFTAVISGYFEVQKVTGALDKFLAKLPVGSKRKEKYPLAYPQNKVQSFIPGDKEQTHIVYGFPGLTFTDERRYTLHVMQSLLAGQGGRLFIELRDKASLAYSVAPLRMEGIEGGYFGAYIGCSPEKASTAIKMMADELNKLSEKLIDGDELYRAQRYLMGRHDIDLQRNSALSAAVLFDEVYDVDYQEIYHYDKYIAQVKPEDVQRLAQDLFSQPSVLCAIGRECPW